MSEIVEAAQTTFSENLGGLAQKLAPAGAQFSLDDVPDQTGKVAVVTGGSQGIGYGFTHSLLSKNVSKLFILSGSKDVVDKAGDAVKEELGEEKAKRIQWIQLDLSDWKKAAEVAKEISDNTDRLDIVFNNAGRGIMTFELDQHGVDRHMAVNHIGHVVLTSHLLPLLKKTAEGGNTVRIVNQSSNLHQNAPKETKFASLEELNTDFGPTPQYGRAKLAAILYSKYLNKHLTSQQPKILANATHPGVVKTKMSQEDIHEPYPMAGYGMSVALAPFKKDVFEGALSALFASTKTENSGEYICPPAAPEAGSELANDDQLAENLMKLTREVITEKGGLEPIKDY